MQAGFTGAAKANEQECIQALQSQQLPCSVKHRRKVADGQVEAKDQSNQEATEGNEWQCGSPHSFRMSLYPSKLRDTSPFRALPLASKSERCS